MECMKCGTQNHDNAKFCSGCGNSLEQMQMMNQVGVQNQNYNYQINNPEMYNNEKVVGNQNIKGFNLFLFIMQAFLNPIKSFKEKSQEVMETKNSLLLGIIVAVIAVALSLINKVISTVRIMDYFNKETSWNWENLNGFPWFNTIGKDILLFGGIIFGVALLFYLASLIIKKDTNYLKMLSIVSVALVPSVIGIYVLGPIFGMLWDKLAIVFSIMGICYTITILCELINKEIQLEDDQKIYFNFICFSIIFIVLFFVIYQMTIGSALDTISSGYSDLFS